MLLLFLAVALAGCGTGDGLMPITGEVNYQGKPLEYGTVTFVSPRTRQATAEIADGKIVNVTTKKSNDGLAPGEYRVTITALDRSEKYRDTMVPPSLIPRKYADYSTSELTATIRAGEANELRFDLEQ